MSRLPVRPHRPHGAEAPVGGGCGVEIEEGFVAAFDGTISVLAAQESAVVGWGVHGGLLSVVCISGSLEGFRCLGCMGTI